MKAWMAALVLSLAPLAACGPSSKEMEQARGDADTLRKENTKLKTRVTELEGSLQQVRQERDQLKVAAAAKPASAPVPAPAAPKKAGATARK